MPPVPDLVVAISIAAGVLALLWLVQAFARRKLQQAQKTETHVDDFLLSAAERTKLFLLVVPAAYLGVRVLEIDTKLMDLLRTWAQLSLIAQAALWVTGLLDVWIRSYRRRRLGSDPTAVMTLNALRIVAALVLWTIALIAALDNLGFKATTLIAGLGIGGVALALAAQNILADLFASFSIVIDKPFVLGDTIAVDAYSGTVEHIGLKTTRLRSADGEELVLSNSDLLKSRIRNYRGITERRAVVRLGFPSSIPPDTLARIPALLRSAVEKQPAARFDRAHLVSLGGTVQYELVYFVSEGDSLDVQQEVGLEILRMLGAEKIALA